MAFIAMRMIIIYIYIMMMSARKLNLRGQKSGDGRIAKLLGGGRMYTTIDLSDNDLTLLPESIGKQRRLKKLILSNNKIKSLPIEIGNLQNLREFNVSENQLESLPTVIGCLRKLILLDASKNQLTSLPTELLHPDKNLLRRLLPGSMVPSPLPKLRILYLYRNQLESLPPWIRDLPSLKSFLFHDNPSLIKFSELRELINFLHAKGVAILTEDWMRP